MKREGREKIWQRGRGREGERMMMNTMKKKKKKWKRTIMARRRRSGVTM